jgi:hypothetical protein
MASLLRGRKGYLLVQFYYQRQLCREYLGLPDTRDNRRDQKEFLRKLEAALRLGTFQYTEFFPDSRRAPKFQIKLGRNTVLDYFNSYLETHECRARSSSTTVRGEPARVVHPATA